MVPECRFETPQCNDALWVLILYAQLKQLGPQFWT